MNPSAPLRRCVIADDVRASREMLKQSLASLDLEFELCCDGQAAWESVLVSPPSVIVTDIEMPRLTGLQLLRNVRGCSDHAVATIPVIVITSLLDSEIRRIVDIHKADTVIVKPLSRETTCVVVERLLRGDPVEPVYDPSASLSGMVGGQGISPTLRRLVRDADL